MEYPPFLRIGGRIGVAAPSFRITKTSDVKRLYNAVRRLKERGYDTVVTDSVIDLSGNGYTNADVRSEELMSLFKDGSIAYIVSVKGGETEDELFPLLDWDYMREHPKWMQGYSDNTSILFKYTVDHDVATVYCGNFLDYGMEPWHDSVSGCLEFIEGARTEQDSFPKHERMMSDHGDGLGPISEDEDSVWTSSAGDTSFKGRLIGGCMDVLNDILQSGSADVPSFVCRYEEDGIIWYMETYDMSVDRIQRMFSEMDTRGWFGAVRGFVFGRPLFYEGDYQKDVTEMLSGYGVPLVFGADVGHLAPRMTFINGAVAEFTVKGMKGSIRYVLR